MFEMFKSGDRVFVPGASGTPVTLAARAFATPGLNITTSFVPGVNIIAENSMAAGTSVCGFFMQPGTTQAQHYGQFRHLPVSYAAALKYLAAQPPFDTCLIQLSPPDQSGVCSLGPAAEFAPGVLRRAHQVAAIINPAVPRLAHAPLWRLADCDHVIDDDTPLTNYDPGVPDDAARTIAGLAASLVSDGSVLQLGLGKVPAAIYSQLRNHRDLKFHTGMMSDGIMALANDGVLKQDFAHKTTVILGSVDLYRWAAERQDIHVVGCEHIHAPRALAELDKLIAINSALEVDLFGQCNLEFTGGRAISGAGGAPDFAHAAHRSTDGISMIVLPATFGNGKGSRIKPALGPNAITSLPRTDVDVVITEDGIADLRGKSVHERAEALIEIAAYQFRPALSEAWASVKKQL